MSFEVRSRLVSCSWIWSWWKYLFQDLWDMPDEIQSIMSKMHRARRGLMCRVQVRFLPQNSRQRKTFWGLQEKVPTQRRSGLPNILIEHRKWNIGSLYEKGNKRWAFSSYTRCSNKGQRIRSSLLQFNPSNYIPCKRLEHRSWKQRLDSQYILARLNWLLRPKCQLDYQTDWWLASSID